MLNLLRTTVDDASANHRGKVVALYVFLLAVNALVWTWAVIALAGRPTLLGTAFLAYVLGLRHAVDADHIAAIDNVTRKLMQRGERPISVGLYFSLGHSTVVVLASVCVALAAASFERRADLRQERSKLVAELHRLDRRGHREINAWVNRAVGIDRVEGASIKQLQRSIETLEKELRRIQARRPARA